MKTPPEIEVEEIIEEPPVQVREKMVANNNEIMLLILTYLEGADPDGPSLDTFKVAMINKSFLHMIKTIYQIDDFQYLASLHAKQKMVELFETPL